ncbi:predicted protein [Naegleria gruberi]|uniref:Predicted protein n=1 Tax=Naegleria gruberi TaxID=5762 RepID=D2V5M1_NAEGR|nr:uncharacterized protein NAEGRDRAFT_64129 [Naegleria gruberi]EFC47671.1 predicted protein [Naegleria gruberi]|eukprot:XP_002680415.1 predicted protein [Naegleria gruberi strain NEG-M]
MIEVEPMKPVRIICELKATPNDAVDDDQNNNTEQKNPKDEFGYPKTSLEYITKYYQDHPEESSNPENFAIIVGSDNYDGTHVKAMIFDLEKYNIKDVIAMETTVIFLAKNGVCYCLLYEESNYWTHRLNNANEINGEIAYAATFSLEDPVERVIAREGVMFITKSGRLIYWNRSDNLEFEPAQFDYEKIVDIALGDGHTLFLSENGNLYGYGSNTAGQLGNDISHKSHHVKFNISHIPDRIVKVYATYNTTLVLTESGHVYSCGDSSYGAHGHANYTEGGGLCKIDFPHRVVDIFPGLFFVALKTIQDEYYVFGYNNMSQFGQSHTIEERINGPHYLDTFQQENIERLSCGGYHSLIVTKDQRVYIAGWPIAHDCFPSKEKTYHFVDVNAILGRKIPLPSYTELYATTGLYYILIQSKSKSTNRFNFKKSYKICDISFNFETNTIEPYPAFMNDEYH